MNTPPTPITHSGSNSFSRQSVKKDEYGTCFCGRRARICTSWTLKNPGRRFYKCASAKGMEGCHFFEWFEEDFSPKVSEVITHLNQRRIFLEEKLELVEANLSEMTGKKKVLKEEKKHLCVEILRVQAEKNKLKKQLIFCLCVVAVFFFVTVVNM
nr:PREDICTED: ERI1 exoribonuclease 2-like [Daucus carota subsp. sativus]